MKKTLLSLTITAVMMTTAGFANIDHNQLSPQQERNATGGVLENLQKWFSEHDFEGGIALLTGSGNTSKNNQQRQTIEQVRQQNFEQATCFDRNTMKVIYTANPNEIGKPLFEMNLFKRWEGEPTASFLQVLDSRNDRVEITIHYKDKSGVEKPGVDVVAANQNYLLRGEDYRAHANQDKTRFNVVCFVPTKYHTAQP